MENIFVLIGAILSITPFIFMMIYCGYDISPIDLIKKGRNLWKHLR